MSDTRQLVCIPCLVRLGCARLCGSRAPGLAGTEAGTEAGTAFGRVLGADFSPEHRQNRAEQKKERCLLRQARQPGSESIGRLWLTCQIATLVIFAWHLLFFNYRKYVSP